MKKIGNSAFVFNVGSGTTYRPLTITAPSNTSDAFTAEYYSAGQTLGSTKDTTITFVSDCGYWKLDRNVGSSNITPKFAFDSLLCDYLTVKPVHIALWNGTKWTDKGEAVTESTNKTTSSAMTSYGYFAFAYDLKSGDAPQMPYPLTIGSTCSYVELQFTSNDIWFSFTPDSAVVKGSFTSPDTSKTYAFIKRAAIYEAYQVGDTLQSVSMKTWPFDSMLVEFQNYVVDLTPSTNYLMKVSKFDVTEGSGIYDSINYYINMCLFNLRMQMSPTFRPYSDLTTLVDILGTVDSPHGLTRGGDVVLPSTTGLSIDLTSLTSPLLVEEGVTFCGDYDILSESFDVSIPGTTSTITTSPTGTLIYSSERRGEYIFPPLPNPGLQPEGYLFYMMPGSIIRNIRLKGPMPGFQDYNFDNQLCAGIRTFHTSTDEIGTFDILHCEIFNFSYAGIDILVRSDEVTIDNCYIHNISGAGGETSPKGYGIWSQGNIAADSPVTYTIQNNIFDDSKEGIDISPNPTNATIEYCTFGDFFGNENITRHKFEKVYGHPAPTLWTPPSNCFYTPNHNNTCATTYQSLSAAYNITRLSAGHLNIKNCVFHQSAMNISSGYPVNTTLFLLHLKFST
ncbi:MAG: right-handed parallel beta-helix repeat-containing protein [Bacteroidetes bacterium]|nr:right-handed parallel beta-helix repeat-containing protein [Bacteroidota bacterium]